MIDIVRKTNQRLRKNDLKMKRVLADAGYSNGENYKYLESINVDGFIPVHGQYEKAQGKALFTILNKTGGDAREGSMLHSGK